MIGVPKKIKGIEFNLLSPKEKRAISATKIITADTYDDDGFPIDMGLMDPHLGVIEPGLRCKTCGGRVDKCPGHFGHIDLSMPIIHVGYAKTVWRIMQCTCRKCGELLISKENIKKRAAEGKKSTWRKMKTVSVCPHCGEKQKKITLDKPTTFREEGHKLTPKEIRGRLERIKDENLPFLGLSQSMRPEWMVLTVLSVPPVNVRPSITLDSGERSEDDLTHKLVDVLRINQRLQENRDAGAPQLIVEDLWELLQYHVTTYFDNQTSGIPPARHRSGRTLRTLTQRLKGKEGRFRSNLSGKRVNFSARTVITPDQNISINEVGVPLDIAKELTVPINVTEYNIEDIKKIVGRGSKYPGVNYIIRPDGRRRKVTEKNAKDVAENLEPNLTVERQIVDGDIVLFNRQPSLHRMSIMAHQVKVMDYKTFRLHLAVCSPYNADFDGDEMNLHVLQSEEARAEGKILMMTQEQILSPRFGGSVIGGVHDHISGAFLLTHKDSKFAKDETCYLLSSIGYKDKLPKPAKGKYWTGKQIFSLLLPKDLNMEFKASIHSVYEDNKKHKGEGYVKIRKGKLVSGTIDGNAIGSFKGKLLNKIVRNYGKDAGREFIDRATKLSVNAIMLKGFTTGIDEEDIPEEAKKDIENEMKNAENDVNKLVKAYKNGSLEQMPGRRLEETLEVKIMTVLGKVRDEAGEIAGKHLGMNNSAVIMAVSGARGSMLNLSQMAGSIGQQAVRGERISRGYQNRTLPHFQKGDLSSKARGFVRSSYKSGMTPTEYFFHSMGGREGLVDTAVRTSRSGYMQRRMVNALEDLKVKYDGTVRNTANTIIQFRYGEDGIDPTKSVMGDAVDIDDIIRKVIPIEIEEKEEVKKIRIAGEEEMGLPKDVEPEEEGIE